MGKFIIRLLLRYSQAQTLASIAEKSNLKPSVMHPVRPRKRWLRQSLSNYLKQFKLLEDLRALLRSTVETK